LRASLQDLIRPAFVHVRVNLTPVSERQKLIQLSDNRGGRDVSALIGLELVLLALGSSNRPDNAQNKHADEPYHAEPEPREQRCGTD
jgi:hypothetical protein